jgi:hypothetical protein
MAVGNTWNLWYLGHTSRGEWPMAKKSKKPGRPRTTGPGEQVKLRCHRDFLAAVDEWRTRQSGEPASRPKAIMQLAWLALLDARK